MKKFAWSSFLHCTSDDHYQNCWQHIKYCCSWCKQSYLSWSHSIITWMVVTADGSSLWGYCYYSLSYVIMSPLLVDNKVSYDFSTHVIKINMQKDWVNFSRWVTLIDIDGTSFPIIINSWVNSKVCSYPCTLFSWISPWYVLHSITRAL